MESTAPFIDTAPDAGRRHLLLMAGSLAMAGPLTSAASSQAATGWVVPRSPAPRLNLTGSDGRSTDLPTALLGKVTAVQLMFTGCGTTCPTQGALFAAVADSLRTTGVQLLSISIDVLGDTPARLREWQGRFGVHPAWRTAVADVAQVDRLADFMKGSAAKPGTHTAQVFVFDRLAHLCHRTGDSPSFGEVQRLLAQAT